MVKRNTESRAGSAGIANTAPAAPQGRPLNQAGRPTAAELERRKAKIMEVATDLFVHHGYAATSLVDIAKGAGVATRTLYQHFGDKETLFRDVIFARETGAVIPAPVLENGETLMAALMKTAGYMHTYSLRPRPIDLMRLMIAESKRFPELIRGVATGAFARFRRNIARMFESLARAKLIPESDYDRLAELFSDLILGSAPVMTYAEWITARTSEPDIEERVRLFILGAFGPAVARKAEVKQARLPRARRAASAFPEDDGIRAEGGPGLS